MEFAPTILETKRLILKGISPRDMAFIFGQFAKEEVKEILGHRTDGEYEKELYKQNNGYAAYNRSFILFLLTEKESGTIIGRCGLHNWSVDHNRAELGYIMADESYKQKGLMTEAVGEVLKHGFTELQLHRIEALVGSHNVPSLSILRKYGFIREGLLREHYYIDGRYEDSIVFSKLNSEYLNEMENKSVTF
jgi:ribosomal-protein-alanine N-acetyltransferase